MNPDLESAERLGSVGEGYTLYVEGEDALGSLSERDVVISPPKVREGAGGNVEYTPVSGLMLDGWERSKLVAIVDGRLVKTEEITMEFAYKYYGSDRRAVVGLRGQVGSPSGVKTPEDIVLRNGKYWSFTFGKLSSEYDVKLIEQWYRDNPMRPGSKATALGRILAMGDQADHLKSNENVTGWLANGGEAPRGISIVVAG